MQQLFIAKIRLNNRETLIFCNETSFAPVSTYFPGIHSLDDLLNLSKKVLFSQEIHLSHSLPEAAQFQSLIESQLIFATGCTYHWAQEKIDLMNEENIYKKLYLANRPMIFMKGTSQSVALNHQNIKLRKDSVLTIPEAELVAVFNKDGEIIGHTIGNDVSAIDLEKENPLYQMQGKFYHGSVSLLPLIKLSAEFPNTNLRCQVFRKGQLLVDVQYQTTNFTRDQNNLVNAAHQLRLTNNGGFLFLGCNADYPMENPLTSDDQVIISSELFPLELINSCNWLE